MFSQKGPSRQAPGIFSYMEFFTSRLLSYLIFFGTPIGIAFFAMIFNAIYLGEWNYITGILYFLEIFSIFMATCGIGAIGAIIMGKLKSPILVLPPKGWALQLNAFFSGVIGVSFLFGKLLVIFLKNITFQEVFFMLGTIEAYILAFIIYFSFTTVGRPYYLFLALIQPVVAIILYSLYSAQISIIFFIRAIIFFCTCAFIFALPYARRLFYVSNIHREVTGIGGYGFIRAFTLSMMTEGNDSVIENIFDRIGVESNIKIQYLFIRSASNKKLKGMFVVPNVHFGPFKTCGSSDLPELIYKGFEDIPGTTVYHTTNDHTQNLTTQVEVDRVLTRIKADVQEVASYKWEFEVKDFARKTSENTNLLGFCLEKTPITFITRHPLPSDDIQSEVGEEIREIAKSHGFQEIIIIDAHNSIIGDEVLITKNSKDAQDIINVTKNYLTSKKVENLQKVNLLYGTARDPLDGYSEKEGIGYGGMIVHIFKNATTNQKTALIHFDGNNALVDVRSYILNMLQNKGIERGEVTTSDSHTVARQFSSRGYSPIGEQIRTEKILEKLAPLLQKAEKDLEPVEFCYHDSIEEKLHIWGNPKYFDTIMTTLQECIRVSQTLLTFSLIVPTFFSLILLLFYYNIQLSEII